MKLLRTNLLKKYNDTTVESIVTASHFDFIRRTSRDWFKKCFDLAWLKERLSMIWESILIGLMGLLFIPVLLLIVLTFGWIMAPYEYFRHISYQKRLIKRFGIERLNKEAAERVKKKEEGKE